MMSDLVLLIQSCAAGDARARHTFQEEYGDAIYNFPVKIYGLPLDQAGDFYLYVFDKDRIFNRISTFEGRNNIQFQTFLSFYVLKHLFLEWRRTCHEIDTISLHTPVGDSTEGGERTLEDVLADSAATAPEMSEVGQERPGAGLWDAFGPQERLDLKLLMLVECDLEPEDLRLLANLSGRSLGETMELLAEVQEGLKRKDVQISRLRDELDSVWGWILLRQKELQEIDKKIHRMATAGDSAVEEQVARRQELERSLAKRYRQRERLVQELRTYKVTTPYKDIARLLNLTVGTVCSRIFRLRERMVQEFGENAVLKERAS